MFTIRIADLNFRIENKFEYIKELCRDYITEDGCFDLTVSPTLEEIAKEGEGESEQFPASYLESLAVYRKIAEWLPLRDGFLMHGVLFEAENRGILLCARSGVGKSTHMALWKRLLGDSCRVINGDKPLIRIIDGKVYGYGTPWCGKEGIHINDKTVLTDICFVERNDINITEKFTDNDIIPRLFQQIYLPKSDGAQKLKALDLAGGVMEKVNFWKIRCNKEPDAAEVAYRALFGEQK